MNKSKIFLVPSVNNVIPFVTRDDFKFPWLFEQLRKKQAGAELGQAQLKLELGLCFTPFKFLSSANEVSTGPTCQFLSVCLSVCLSFRSFFQGV